MANKYIIHGATYNGDGTSSAESTGMPFPDPKTGKWRDGCRVVPIAWAQERDLFEMRKIKHPYPDLAWQHAEQMADEMVEYDHEYLRDWIFRRQKNGNEKKVTCHEYPDICCSRAGQALLPAGMKHSTPRDLYLLSEAI